MQHPYILKLWSVDLFSIYVYIVSMMLTSLVTIHRQYEVNLSGEVWWYFEC